MISKMCDFCKKKDVCKYIDKYNELVKNIEAAQIEEPNIFNIAVTCIYYDDGIKYHFTDDRLNYRWDYSPNDITCFPKCPCCNSTETVPFENNSIIPMYKCAKCGYVYSSISCTTKAADIKCSVKEDIK